MVVLFFIDKDTKDLNGYVTFSRLDSHLVMELGFEPRKPCSSVYALKPCAMHSDSHCITNILIRLNLSSNFSVSARRQRSEWVGGKHESSGS